MLWRFFANDLPRLQLCSSGEVNGNYRSTGRRLVCEELSAAVAVIPSSEVSLTQPSDQAKGKVGIQVDGPIAGASISFWNKGDVQALVLDKVSKRDYSLDDRVLNPAEDVSALLSSYCERILTLVNNTSKSAP